MKKQGGLVWEASRQNEEGWLSNPLIQYSNPLIHTLGDGPSIFRCALSRHVSQFRANPVSQTASHLHCCHHTKESCFRQLYSTSLCEVDSVQYGPAAGPIVRELALPSIMTIPPHRVMSVRLDSREKRSAWRATQLCDETLVSRCASDFPGKAALPGVLALLLPLSRISCIQVTVLKFVTRV
ncbi:hypothetical protein BCV70DRAFT_206134 [Testicularia cyperi]|uniref:Uncharacterized protein n=1 Tax=Testicularia cyperi TaxID=1882483 RepID=A0A317XS44_9BASI|nr:hypothetical protein BCV70DRAFT_206134 [Testicularia cyperi]